MRARACTGWPRIADGVGRMADGRADRLIAARLERWAGQVEGRGACHHPNGVVRFVRSGLQVFADELDDHHRHGPCGACDRAPVLGVFGRRGDPADGGGGMSRRLRVDPIACTAHGLCAELFPEGIELDDWGYPIVLARGRCRHAARPRPPRGGGVPDAGAAPAARREAAR